MTQLWLAEALRVIVDKVVHIGLKSFLQDGTGFFEVDIRDGRPRSRFPEGQRPCLFIGNFGDGFSKVFLDLLLCYIDYCGFGIRLRLGRLGAILEHD